MQALRFRRSFSGYHYHGRVCYRRAHALNDVDSFLHLEKETFLSSSSLHRALRLRLRGQRKHIYWIKAELSRIRALNEERLETSFLSSLILGQDHLVEMLLSTRLTRTLPSSRDAHSRCRAAFLTHRFIQSLRTASSRLSSGPYPYCGLYSISSRLIPWTAVSNLNYTSVAVRSCWKLR